MIPVVFALEFESAGFQALASRRLCVSVWTLGVTGARSPDALERLLGQNGASAVVSAGFSGALTADLQLGDILLAENFSDLKLLDAIRHIPDVRVATTVTVDAILETSKSKRDLGAKTGAVAADMETARLHKVCQSHGIPMLSLRVISDTLQDDMPLPGSVLIDPTTGRSEPAQIFHYLFRHPISVPRFAKLVRNAKIAQRALASSLEQVMPFLLRSAG